MKMNVFSLNSQLYKVTGVEKVMLDIHQAVCQRYNAKIVGTIPYNKINQNHPIPKEDYIRLLNPFIFYKSIVIVHERKFLPLLWLLNHLFFQHIKIIYIHHNLFYNNIKATILPKTIVAIADAGIKNLIEIFNAPRKDIHKIPNCVKDKYVKPHRLIQNSNISILLPGRINDQKQQIEIVKHLQDKIDKRITIMFAGDGPSLKELESLCSNNPQFKVLGFRDDIYSLINHCDFVMLFSKHEGLPITLIEATMLGVPIICNDVGGNGEICKDNYNGFVAKDWHELINIINRLPLITELEYKRLCSNSRTKYTENFTFDIFKDKYLNLFSNIDASVD